MSFLHRRKVRAAALMVAVSVSAAGCGWRGLNSIPLPGTEGTGAGSYKVYIQMPDVTTLTDNSPVRVNDVTVGTVKNIEVQGWHALVTVSLNPDVHLPKNAIARIGQTSLLGSTHVELAAPTDQRPEGELKGGDTVPLVRAGAYPTTEQTLSAVSVVLNGGGFAALGDITKELDAALGGRADAVRDLVGRLNTLAGGLNAQRRDIVTALEGLDRLGGVFAQQTTTVDAALDKVPPALKVLVSQRQNITDALRSLGKLSDVASQIVRSDGANLQANLHHLGPVLKSLADTGNHLTDVLSLLLTFPFPMHTVNNAIKGDYLNLYMTLDLTNKRLAGDFLTGTPLQQQRPEDHPAPTPALPPASATQTVDPLLGPLTALLHPPAPQAPAPPQGPPVPAPNPVPRGGR